MAITLTFIGKSYFGAGIAYLVYDFTGTSSGDTSVVSVSGPPPYKTEFIDANGNQIVTSPPTFGAWTTSGDVSSSTVTANAGGVITHGKMILLTGGS
jgi:hypothetical protein